MGIRQFQKKVLINLARSVYRYIFAMISQSFASTHNFQYFRLLCLLFTFLFLIYGHLWCVFQPIY
jgi:hypothetical protein